MERYYEAIDLLKGMISRPSFSRDETAVADFLQAEWQKAGHRQARFRLDQRPVHSRRDRG